MVNLEGNWRLVQVAGGGILNAPELRHLVKKFTIIELVKPLHLSRDNFF
jgi:hypothetical protein